jgi:hypothetical protein
MDENPYEPPQMARLAPKQKNPKKPKRSRDDLNDSDNKIAISLGILATIGLATAYFDEPSKLLLGLFVAACVIVGLWLLSRH